MSDRDDYADKELPPPWWRGPRGRVIMFLIAYVLISGCITLRVVLGVTGIVP